MLLTRPQGRANSSRQSCSAAAHMQACHPINSIVSCQACIRGGVATPSKAWCHPGPVRPDSVSSPGCLSLCLPSTVPPFCWQVLVAGTEQQVQEALEAAEPCKEVGRLPPTCDGWHKPGYKALQCVSTWGQDGCSRPNCCSALLRQTCLSVWKRSGVFAWRSMGRQAYTGGRAAPSASLAFGHALLSRLGECSAVQCSTPRHICEMSAQVDLPPVRHPVKSAMTVHDSSTGSRVRAAWALPHALAAHMTPCHLTHLGCGGRS